MVEVVDWNNFLRRFTWEQGDHLSVIGPTNSGKTTLLLSLIHRRDWVVILGTKPYTKESTLAQFIKKNRYVLSPVWPVINRKKVVLWPPYNVPEDKEKQRKVFHSALLHIFSDKGRCVVADEVWYHTNVLKLNDILEAYWSQGREIGLTLAAATQRPRNVSLMMYSQATHLFFYKMGDKYDRNRLADIGNADSDLVAHTIQKLGFREFLYVNAADGSMMRSKVRL